jgi:hypothetical protein
MLKSVAAFVASFLLSGCGVTYATVGNLDDLSPIYHLDSNEPEAAWITTRDGHDELLVRVRDSVRIRDRFTSLEPPTIFCCEPNGAVLVRYRLDTTEDPIPVESIIEPGTDAAPTRAVEIPVFCRSVHEVAPESVFAQRPGPPLPPARGLTAPRSPAVVVWEEGAREWPHGHGDASVCCWMTTVLVRRDGTSVRLAMVSQDTCVPGRAAQLVLLPIALTLDAALLPVYGLWLLLFPPFI